MSPSSSDSSMIPSIRALRDSACSSGTSGASSPTRPVTSVPDMTGTSSGSTLSPALPNDACAAARTPA